MSAEMNTESKPLKVLLKIRQLFHGSRAELPTPTFLSLSPWVAFCVYQSLGVPHG